ncbi:isochorismatase [Xylariales sp. AK1849]|nr:isochorismatase [Xylariales sp. AK1849]
MFPIDASLFPKLTTRRALIVVDAQNDFLSADGALLAGAPNDLTARIVRLVQGFRPYGDIVWIRSEYGQPRSAKSEQIITSDVPSEGNRRPGPRGRRLQSNAIDQLPPSRCPEAFLSEIAPGRPECVRKGTTGAEMPAAIAELVEKKDLSFVKTQYSAFKLPQLIQRLRMKFVNEVFICGSSSNIGVMATAIDAASHGLDIAIVADCCGYRSSARHSAALKQIEDTTGCDIISTDGVLDLLKPKMKHTSAKPTQANPLGRRYPVVYEQPNLNRGNEQSTTEADIASALAKESLKSDADASLPPIVYTRARFAARGRPRQPLPDIEKQLRGKVSISGSMNASPMDDLNASGNDDSEDEGPTKTPAPAQAQNGIEGTEEKFSETIHNAPKNIDGSKETGVESALRNLNLEDGERSRSSDIPPPAKENPALSANVLESTKPTTSEAVFADNSISNSRSSTIKTANTNIMNANETNQTASEPLCEGDTRVHYNVLPEPFSKNMFQEIRDEVHWLRMSHQGGEVPRLVAVQGEVDKDGNIPVYRHPADESPPLLPWTSAVREIRNIVEKKVGHPLNHALIQFYRDGNDYISEHSDKTLDIAKGSFIVNVSLGAERTMVLRTKRQPRHNDNTQPEVITIDAKREVQRARLPHNSMCQMGLQTNKRWLHAIRQDKRLDREKSAEELAYEGARISLTFRQIVTFLDREQKLIWGQGAKAKTREEAHGVVNGQSPEAIEMLKAFGRENQSTDFDWYAFYGPGFDVLHISAAPRLFTSSDVVANMRVQLMLAELSVGYAKGSLAPVSTRVVKDVHAKAEDLLIKFVDNDDGKSTVHGEVAIMLYLDRYYGKAKYVSPASQADTARQFTRFQQALSLLYKHRTNADPQSLKQELSAWEKYAAESDFIAGSAMTLADFAFWPVLYDIVGSNWQKGAFELPNLIKYHERIRKRETVVMILRKDREGSPKQSPKKGGDVEDAPGQEASKETPVEAESDHVEDSPSKDNYKVKAEVEVTPSKTTRSETETAAISGIVPVEEASNKRKASVSVD